MKKVSFDRGHMLPNAHMRKHFRHSTYSDRGDEVF